MIRLALYFSILWLPLIIGSRSWIDSDILIDGGKFSRVNIRANNPVKSFTVENAAFTNIKTGGTGPEGALDAAVFLYRNNAADYKDILIQNNTFTSIDSIGIMVIGFTKRLHFFADEDGDPIGGIRRIDILNNTLTNGNTNGSTAIKLLNTTSYLNGNSITAIPRGVVISGSEGVPEPVRSLTLLCNNQISVCNKGNEGVGLWGDYWRGYFKLGEISESDWGAVVHKDVIRSRISNSLISGNLNSGITLRDIAILDLLENAHQYWNFFVDPFTTVQLQAFNVVSQNNTASGHPRGQIEIHENATLKLGGIATPTYKFGGNIVTRNGAEDNFLFCPDAGGVNVGDISGNYWQNGDESEYTPPTSDANNPFEGVSYTFHISALLSSVEYKRTDANCLISAHSGGERTKDNSQHPQSTSDSSLCAAKYKLLTALIDGSRAKEAYDTGKAYIEECAMQYKSWLAFGELSEANQFRSDDLSRHKEFREWLKSVLYLNPDYRYYCEDVDAMLYTFAWFDDERKQDVNGMLTVVKYILDNNKCPYSKDFFTAFYINKRAAQLAIWADTVKDSLATPLDTTLPTLEELDLTILYGPPGSVSPVAEMRIGTLTASPNPFGENLELRYELIKSATVRIDVFDILGKTIYESPQGFKEKGEHQLTIPTQWTSGTYYIRLSTPSGEIKSVKVIKE